MQYTGIGPGGNDGLIRVSGSSIDRKLIFDLCLNMVFRHPGLKRFKHPAKGLACNLAGFPDQRDLRF